MDDHLAQSLVQSLREAGVNFVSYVPESRLNQMLPLMREDETFQQAAAANETEAVNIAIGAALGGKQAACYMESSGLFVSSFNLIGMGLQMGVPLLIVAGFLGGFNDQRNSFMYAPFGARTAPLLDGLGISYQLLEDGEGLPTKVNDAVRMANSLRAPVALLFAGEFTR